MTGFQLFQYFGIDTTDSLFKIECFHEKAITLATNGTLISVCLYAGSVEVQLL